MSFTTEKLKSAAKKIYQLIESSGNDEKEQMQSILNSCTSYFKKYQTYFSHFSPAELLKIIIYVYSLKRSSNYLEGDKILQNLRFAKLFTTNFHHLVEECDECAGHGTVNCDLCGGNATIECSHCDGAGGHTCEDCNGTGRIEFEDESEVDCDTCDGEGEITCSWCEGSGDVDCPECDDSGTVECDVCNGQGETEDRETYSYEIEFVMSWDSNFNNICEMREKESIPISNSDDWSEFNCIFLNLTEEKAKINTDLIEPELYYCVYFSDEPKGLRFDFQNRSFVLPTDRSDIMNYL